MSPVRLQVNSKRPVAVVLLSAHYPARRRCCRFVRLGGLHTAGTSPTSAACCMHLGSFRFKLYTSWYRLNDEARTIKITPLSPAHRKSKVRRPPISCINCSRHVCVGNQSHWAGDGRGNAYAATVPGRGFTPGQRPSSALQRLAGGAGEDSTKPYHHTRENRVMRNQAALLVVVGETRGRDKHFMHGCSSRRCGRKVQGSLLESRFRNTCREARSLLALCERLRSAYLCRHANLIIFRSWKNGYLVPVLGERTACRETLNANL